MNRRFIIGPLPFLIELRHGAGQRKLKIYGSRYINEPWAVLTGLNSLTYFSSFKREILPGFCCWFAKFTKAVNLFILYKN